MFDLTSGGMIMRRAFLAAFLLSQSLDPFYLTRFKTALGLCEARQYQAALQELEVAAFGLSSRRDLLAEAYTLMGFCQAKLGENDKSIESLTAAADLVGWEALVEISAPEAVKADLKKVIAEARKRPPPKAESRKSESVPITVPGEKIPPRAEKTPSTPPAKSLVLPPPEKPDRNSIQGLQAAIHADPRYAVPYYALASLQAQKGDFYAARKTMRELLRNIPTEVRGHLELGRLAYEARDLKEAGKSLERFLALAEKSADERSKDEARALLILVSYLRGDDKKARAVLAASAGLFTPARLAALTLAPREVDRVLVIRAELGKK